MGVLKKLSKQTQSVPAKTNLSFLELHSGYVLHTSC